MKIAAIVAVLLFVVCIAGSFYMISYSLSSKRNEFSEKAEWARVDSLYPHIQSWTDSIRRTGALRDSFIINDEGQRIHVYWLPAQRPTNRSALIIHGYGTCAIDMMHIGYMYHHDLGYNIFLYDQYGHGLSEGDVIQMGWKDRYNALACLRVMGEGVLPAYSQQIVVHGISMGAATTMMLSGESDLPSSVKAFVDDCGYTSVWDEFKGEMKARFGLPAFPLLHMSSAICKLRYGWSFGEASALDQVAKCHLPMLFIHGTEDTFVPTSMVQPLYDAHPGPKNLWLAPGSVHAYSYHDHPEEYTRRVGEFLDSCLAPSNLLFEY